MEKFSNAVYLGNTDGEYCGFTVGKEYAVHNYDTEDNYIVAFDDDGGYRQINNGAFHKFGILEDDDGFRIERNGFLAAAFVGDKKPDLRYYINGHEVDMIEFENVRYKVEQLDDDGVKCDTIKFEVKFE